MSELLVNDASTIAASTATTLAGRSTDGLETLLDQLSATLQRSEVDGVSLPTQSQTRALEPLFVFGLAGARYGVSMSQVVASCRSAADAELDEVAQRGGLGPRCGESAR